MDYFKNKAVLITGGAGSVGRVLIKKLVAYGAKKIIVLDNNESEIFHLQNEHLNSVVECYVTDISHKDSLTRRFKDIDLVFHLAALKHVVLGESSPDSIVETNIKGLINVLDASCYHNVKKVVFTSSDKAVNSTNVMGTSKLFGERIVTAFNSFSHANNTICCSTRFGNVLGSNGSVLPIFKRQLTESNHLTLTDERMTRFFMTDEQAVDLVLKSCVIAEGGEVFVTKMPVVKIKDLAEVLIENFAKKPMTIKIIGAKPGEKLYEELLSNEEKNRTVEIDDFFVILPAFNINQREIKYSYVSADKKGVSNPYNSSVEKPVSKEELLSFINEHKLVNE